MPKFSVYENTTKRNKKYSCKYILTHIRLQLLQGPTTIVCSVLYCDASLSSSLNGQFVNGRPDVGRVVAVCYVDEESQGHHQQISSLSGWAEDI